MGDAMTFWTIVAFALVLFVAAVACVDLVLTDRANARKDDEQ